MRVLVTGASGFIGGKVCDRLLEQGIAHRGCGRRTIQRAEYFTWDLSQPLKLSDSDHFDVIVHAAARSSPWGTKSEFVRDNIQATQNILDYCRTNGQPKLVFISSSSVYYCNRHQFDITEQTEQARQPLNQYAATKQIAERMVRDYEGDWVIFRPRAVFGPGDTVLLPRILEAARCGRLPILVASGPPIVGDLIYIDNLVDYIIRAAQSPKITGEFNLTNNQPIEINAFLLDIFRRLKIAVPRRILSVRTAMWAAGLLELAHRVLKLKKEPPITRFGVHVFAYSKTFDVSKSIAAMGHPRMSIAEGVEAVVEEYLSKHTAIASRE